MICMFASNSVPSNFIVCDGRELLKTAYPQLFQAIGTIYGESADKLKFKIPDLRGKFVRCVGGNAAALGVSQSDAIRNIKGSIDRIRVHVHNNVTSSGVFAHKPYANTGDASNGATTSYIFDFDASRVVPTANENRPINMSMNYAIQVN